MKRIPFILVVLIAVFGVPRVFAAAPLLAQASTPATSALPPESTWTTGNCDGPAKPGDPPCKIAPDIADDTIVKEQSTLPCTIANGHLNCQNLIRWITGYHAAPDYKTPAYDKIGNWLQSADVKLNPEIVQEATVNNDNPQYESQATRRCVYDENGKLKPDSNQVSNDIITIGPIYGISRITQYADTMSQRYSLREKTVDENGQYNYEQKTEIIDKTLAHDCDYMRTGAPLPVPTPISTAGQIQFSPYDVIVNIVGAIAGQVFKSTEKIIPSKRTAKAEDMMGLSGQVTQGDLADSPVTAEKKSALVQTPGFIETFRPDSLSYRPENINGQIVNAFTGDVSSNNTNTYMTNMLDQSYRFLCNTLFPAAILPEQCKMELSPAPSCDSTTLPDFSPSGSCSLCNTDSIKQKTEMPATVPEGVPPTLKAMLEKLGEVFNVPPSSILAAMYHEGAFTHDIFTGDNAWTEENVKKWSMCTATFPGEKCKNPEGVSAAVCGPGGAGSPRCGMAIDGFGWLPGWFWLGDESNPHSVWTAVMEIDKTRTKETISPCNLLDAAAATAKALSLWATDALPAVSDPMCFDIPLTNSIKPASCNDWTDNIVFRSHVGYAGYCPEPGKNGKYTPNASYKTMVLGWYHAFSCGN